MANEKESALIAKFETMINTAALSSIHLTLA